MNSADTLAAYYIMIIHNLEKCSKGATYIIYFTTLKTVKLKESNLRRYWLSANHGYSHRRGQFKSCIKAHPISAEKTYKTNVNTLCIHPTS